MKHLTTLYYSATVRQQSTNEKEDIAGSAEQKERIKIVMASPATWTIRHHYSYIHVRCTVAGLYTVSANMYEAYLYFHIW